MRTLLIAIVALATLTASAQNRTFKFDLGGCEYRGTYNAKKYSQKQITNTFDLISSGEIGIGTYAAAFKLDDVAKLDVAALDAEYAAKTAKLRALDIVRTTYFEALRSRKLAEMQKVYELSRVSVRGYTDPGALSELQWADSCKTKFAVAATAGGDDLLAAWLSVNMDIRSKNGDPARIKRKYEAEYASPDRMRYAVLEVVTFGWWNCANEFIKYADDHTAQEWQFKKLFVSVKRLGCEEP